MIVFLLRVSTLIAFYSTSLYITTLIYYNKNLYKFFLKTCQFTCNLFESENENLAWTNKIGMMNKWFYNHNFLYNAKLVRPMLQLGPIHS